MKKSSLKLLSLLVFALFIIQNSTNIYAQNSEGGLPKSFKLGKMHKLKKVPFIKMPYFDKNLLLKEDSIVNSSNIAAPFRFAKGFIVDYSAQASKTTKP